MQNDERDASPERFPIHSAHPQHTEAVEEPLPTDKEKRERLSRHVTASSTSWDSIESARRNDGGVSRMTTRQDSTTLERHPTALSRIETGRSQHSHTIGTGIRSRTFTRQSKRPMPNFGGGKPFPPQLPERDEYVVEFDGPDGTDAASHEDEWTLT